jgi:hypothetical protein
VVSLDRHLRAPIFAGLYGAIQGIALASIKEVGDRGSRVLWRHLVKLGTWTFSLALLFGLAAATPAAAQYEERAFISANVGLQLPLNSPFHQDASYPYRQETAVVGAVYTIPTKMVYDVAAGGMITYRVGISFGYSQFKADNTAVFNASIPHPTVFNQPASASFTTPGQLQHRETFLHADLVYAPVVGESVNVKLFGGPSYARIRQDFIEHFDLTENFNLISLAYSVVITGTQQRRAQATGVGFNAGADVSYFFSEHVGVGGLARYVSASPSVTNVLGTAVGSAQTSNASGGGITGGGGLRFRF